MELFRDIEYAPQCDECGGYELENVFHMKGISCYICLNSYYYCNGCYKKGIFYGRTLESSVITDKNGKKQWCCGGCVKELEWHVQKRSKTLQKKL